MQNLGCGPKITQFKRACSYCVVDNVALYSIGTQYQRDISTRRNILLAVLKDPNDFGARTVNENDLLEALHEALAVGQVTSTVFGFSAPHVWEVHEHQRAVSAATGDHLVESRENVAL